MEDDKVSRLDPTGIGTATRTPAEADAVEAKRKRKVREEMFRERSQLLQVWEDLTAELMPAKLLAKSIDDGLEFVVEVKTGPIDRINEIAHARGCEAFAGGFGVTIKPTVGE